MKEDIIARNFKDPLDIKGKQIKILKELPKKMLASQKEYKAL